MSDEMADINIRFQTLKLSLDSLAAAATTLPEAIPWLNPLGMLAIDLTALGCVVRVEVLVQPGVERTRPLGSPQTPRIRLVMPYETHGSD